MLPLSLPLYIVVDGLTGAGKSTLIEQLLTPALEKSGFNVVFVRELAENYGQLLRDYYDDPRRWAYTFQTKVIRDRVDNFKRLYANAVKSAANTIFISERDEHADAVFARVHYELGNMTTIEYQCYCDIWQTMVESLPIRADITIYLDVNVDETLRRVQERGRDGEHVDKSYQEKLAAAARPRVGPNLIITDDFGDEELAQLFDLINIVHDERIDERVDERIDECVDAYFEHTTVNII